MILKFWFFNVQIVYQEHIILIFILILDQVIIEFLW